MSAFVDVAVHLALLLAMPPLLLGVIGRVKARFAGRDGPPLFQLYFDLAKLWRKATVQSVTTTTLFRVGPVLGLVTVVLAALVVPFGHHPAPVAFTGDVVLFAYLLALGRFFTIAAALDTGSAFEGMGASREATFSCLAEPALLLGVMVLSKLSGGSVSLTALLDGAAAGWARAAGPMALVLAAWAIVMLVENSRIPFDDPNTHLELTMVHEVMVLDHSGPALGLILYGSALKLFVLGALVEALVVPVGSGSAAGDWVVFVAGMFALALAIGVVESTMTRLRLLRVPQLLVGASLLSAFGVLMSGR